MIYDIFVVVGFNDNYKRQILSFWNSFLKCTFLKNERVKKKKQTLIVRSFHYISPSYTSDTTL